MQMKWLLAGILSSLALTSCSQNSQSRNVVAQSQDMTGIIGGHELLEGDVFQKSIVAVYNLEADELCTGVLLQNNLVITAAHCVSQAPENMHILFGTNVNWDVTELTVDKFEVSPYWSANRNNDADRGDIALLHFVGKAPNEYVGATLATNNRLLKNNAEVIAVGYGTTSGKESAGVGVLRATNLKISNVLFSKSEVALNQTEGRGVCHGDSGGAVFIKNTNGTYAVWGIVSRGVNDPKYDCSQYAAVTRLTYHKTWLNRMADKLSKSLTDPLNILFLESAKK